MTTKDVLNVHVVDVDGDAADGRMAVAAAVVAAVAENRVDTVSVFVSLAKAH
jgi:hypothetical protein